MISYWRCPWYATPGLLLSLPLVHADESAPAAARMPFSVVIKSGTADPKVARPVAPTELTVEVGVVAPGAQLPIEFEIRNTSSAPVKILGGSKGCSPGGCGQVLGQFPRIVPPGETARIAALYVAPSQPGSACCFEANLYVGATTVFVVPIHVRGFVAPLPTPRTKTAN